MFFQKHLELKKNLLVWFWCDLFQTKEVLKELTKFQYTEKETVMTENRKSRNVIFCALPTALHPAIWYQYLKQRRKITNNFWQSQNFYSENFSIP